MAASSPVQGRRTIPRSRHLPLAVLEGSVTKNFNKSGVRLGTTSSLTEPQSKSVISTALLAIDSRRPVPRGLTIARCAQRTPHHWMLESRPVYRGRTMLRSAIYALTAATSDPSR